MKWQIRTQYTKDISTTYPGQMRAIQHEIRTFLDERDYKIDPQSHGITDSRSNQFLLAFVYQESVLEINVTTENWQSFTQVHRPQIVLLIEDYFKSNSQFWYYLETLNEAELADIQDLGRTWTPLDIKVRLASMQIDQDIPKPKVEMLGDYTYQQTDLYSGTTAEYHDIIDFWISFLTWGTHANIEFNDLSYFLCKGWFDPFHGSCIPKRSSEVAKEINLITNKLKWVREENIKGIYQMRKEWDDCIFLFDMNDTFLIYNWWTSE
ncbi:MAG: hypothetical protein AAF587_38775 [Bacteroidota bacterium]